MGQDNAVRTVFKFLYLQIPKQRQHCMDTETLPPMLSKVDFFDQHAENTHLISVLIHIDLVY